MVKLNIDVLKNCSAQYCKREGDCKYLRESIVKEGVLFPILVSPSMEIVDGQKRIDICKEIGINYISAIFTSKEVDIDDYNSIIDQSYVIARQTGSVYYGFDSIFDYSGQSNDIITLMCRNWRELNLLARIKNDIRRKCAVQYDDYVNEICEDLLNSNIDKSSKRIYGDCGKHSRYGFKGGCNDKHYTRHENMFRRMFPYLDTQVSFGTGKDGYKKYSCKRYIADFVDYRNNCIIEVDGKSHNSWSKRVRDRVRTYFFRDIGFDVIRFTNEEVETLFRDYAIMLIRNIDKVTRGD